MFEGGLMWFVYFVCVVKMLDGMGWGLVLWCIEIIYSIVFGGFYN